LADYDPAAANARRYPRVITESDIDEVPFLEFNNGIGTRIFLSRERDDARYFRQGYCYGEPGHGDYHWDQANFDETHFVLKGRIRLKVEDATGRTVTYEASEGEHIYLPGGFKYTLEDTGVDWAFFWTSGPSPRPGLVEAKDYSNQLRDLRSA
jgi:mannose-6-phosphate isomerase-like protein (cupin superfamily)